MENFRIAIQFVYSILLQIWKNKKFVKNGQMSLNHASFRLCDVRNYGESQILMCWFDFIIFRLIQAIWNHCIKNSEKIWKIEKIFQNKFNVKSLLNHKIKHNQHIHDNLNTYFHTNHCKIHHQIHRTSLQIHCKWNTKQQIITIIN